MPQPTEARIKRKGRSVVRFRLQDDLSRVSYTESVLRRARTSSAPVTFIAVTTIDTRRRAARRAKSVQHAVDRTHRFLADDGLCARSALLCS